MCSLAVCEPSSPAMRRRVALREERQLCYPWDVQAAKDTVRTSDQLPDDCSLDDVLYHLYVIQKVQAGMEDVAAGRLIPHEEVAEELRSRWVKGAGR